MSRVLVAGKGRPDRGGIAAYLDAILDSDLAERHELSFANLTRVEAAPRGGRLTVANVRRTLADAVTVWRAARGVDVVHFHSALVPLVTILRAGLVCLAARLRGARVIVHVHGGDLPRWLGAPGRGIALRIALAAASRVLVVSTAMDETLGPLARGRVLLLPNGVDTQRFAPADRPPQGTPVVLYAGLLTPRKGLLDLFEASAALRAGGLEHELVCAGGTPDEGPEAEAAVRRAAGDARLLGPQEREAMPGLYRQASVFCLPSWWEAMPLSVLEAMASGLPVVATDVGDVGRLVADGETGYVVPPRAPGLLAEALSNLLEDPERRRRMGTAGRERVVRVFGLRAMIDTLDTIYREAGAPR